MVGLTDEILQLDTRAEVLVSILLATHFSLRVILPSLARSPYDGALLSTHMARAHDYDSHAVDIISPSPLLYHLNFIVGLKRGTSNYFILHIL
jgi:hypothetical protein